MRNAVRATFPRTALVGHRATVGLRAANGRVDHRPGGQATAPNGSIRGCWVGPPQRRSPAAHGGTQPGTTSTIARPAPSWRVTTVASDGTLRPGARRARRGRGLVGLERRSVRDGLPRAAGAFRGAVADHIVAAKVRITQWV